ncbi:Clp protease N-terminal domain-containing protein [Micromonosporaceae bacterium Da 78-11]
MPKINVYLPDELADSVRETGVPVSAVCQHALEQAVRRMAAIRQTVLTDLDDADLTGLLPSFTARAVTVLTLAVERARTAGAPNVTTGDLRHGLIAEGGNLALQILTASGVDPVGLTAPDTPEPADGTGLRFSKPAAAALMLAVGEATGLGHNYVGCEHLLIGLAAEPDGATGALLRSRGVDGKSARRAVVTALTGYAHLRATTTPATGLLTAVRAELAPLIERIERLENRVN